MSLWGSRQYLYHKARGAEYKFIYTFSSPTSFNRLSVTYTTFEKYVHKLRTNIEKRLRRVLILTNQLGRRSTAKIERGLGTEFARLGTLRGFGTERARLGSFSGFVTESARLGTFINLGTERTRLDTFRGFVQNVQD